MFTLFSEKIGKVIIDEKLENEFFKNPPILAQEGTDTLYMDSVLVSIDNVKDPEVIINAYIRDSKGNHLSFYTCKSFFSKDTLVVEFKTILNATYEKLKLKIISDKYYVSIIRDGGNKEYMTTPKSLKLREKIDKEGQEIFGELEIEFKDPENNLQYYFEGPFRCIVE